MALTASNGGWELSVAGAGHLQTSAVIDAAGAWCDEVAAMAGIEPLGLRPLRRTAFTFSPPGGVDHRAWPMIVDIDERYYFKPEGPRLLGSPADEAPVPPGDARHEEVDVAVAIERIEAATTMTIRHVASAWAGLRSFVADRRPVIGADATNPRFFWLAGQGGFGIKTSPAAGRAIAALVVADELPADLGEMGITRDDLGPGRLRD
jgi:D-arginine dehydrogenase